MAPGKSQNSLDSERSSSNRSHGRKSSKMTEPMGALASQLQNETEEKKDAIMSEGISCIFNKLPQAIEKLNALLTDLMQMDTQYSSEASLEQSNGKQIDSKYKFAVESAKKTFPPTSSSGQQAAKSGSNSNPTNCKQLLQSACAHHLMDDSNDKAGHTCTSSYTFPNSVYLYPWGPVAANDELNKLTNQLRCIFLELSQDFLNINLGLSLMFPRTEDNEECNLSLDVLNKLLGLSSLEYLDFFETNVNGRADLIDYVSCLPHFGEARRLLFEYDRNACLELQCVVQNLITQCGRLYDSLIKNFDKVLKVKEQCNQARSPHSADSEQSNSPVNQSYYS